MAICRREQALGASGEGERLKRVKGNLQATVGWRVETLWPGDNYTIARIGLLLKRYLPWA
jgi:hypothetical protein